MYAAAWAAHAVGFNRRRLWAAHHGSAVPLAALLAFAALRSPGATLLTVPALRDLAGAASEIATGGAAGLSQYVSEHAQRYFVAALWPSWLPRPGLGARGRRGGVKTHGGGVKTRTGSGGSGSGGPGGRPSSRDGPQRRRQPQAASRPPRHTSGKGGGGGSRGSSSSDSGAAARARALIAAPALLPMRLGPGQLLAAMAAPSLLSLVSQYLAFLPPLGKRTLHTEWCGRSVLASCCCFCH